MKKNVKGFIGLFSALAAVVCTVIAFVPLAPISGTSVKLWGGTNVTLGICGIVLGIIAIIFSIMAIRHSDQKGPRKAGLIIGIIVTVFAAVAAIIGGIFGMIVDYANGKDTGIFSQMDDSQRKEIDDMLNQLRTQYPEK